MIYNQRTIKKTIKFSGIGLHTGKWIRLKIKPAPNNYGIRFFRVDIFSKPEIKAFFKNSVNTNLATVIGSNGIIVSTIEHLMASFAATYIDNAIVETNSPEVPIINGNSKKFIELILKKGIKNQASPKKILCIKKKYTFSKKNKSITISPSPYFKISCKIDYSHKLILEQKNSFHKLLNSFNKKISYSKTFGFLKEIYIIKNHGLGLGGSNKSAIIVGNEKFIKKKKKIKLQVAKHKILDCIGDLSLVGMPIVGEVIINKTGHKFNQFFIKKFIKKNFLWEIKKFKIKKDLS